MNATKKQNILNSLLSFAEGDLKRLSKDENLVTDLSYWILKDVEPFGTLKEHLSLIQDAQAFMKWQDDGGDYPLAY